MNHDKHISITSIHTNFNGQDLVKNNQPNQSLNKSKVEVGFNSLIINNNNSHQGNIDNIINRPKSSLGAISKSDSTKLQDNQLSCTVLQTQFNSSTVKEIHNNVFNFFPISNFDHTKLSKAPNIVTQNNQLEKEINSAYLVKEKNEYIKQLQIENSKLKVNLQEQLIENKSLRSELEKGLTSNQDESIRNRSMEKRIKRASLLSPKSKNECKLS